VTQFEGKNVYVLAVTFNVTMDRAPFLWSSEKFRQSTYLRRVDQADVKLAPNDVFDSALRAYAVFFNFWAFHPVLLTFPTTMPDGSAFLRSVNDVVELHTLLFLSCSCAGRRFRQPARTR
jgi:hypothetical protein